MLELPSTSLISNLFHFLYTDTMVSLHYLKYVYETHAMGLLAGMEVVHLILNSDQVSP